jgi:hypothetical protein
MDEMIRELQADIQAQIIEGFESYEKIVDNILQFYAMDYNYDDYDGDGFEALVKTQTKQLLLDYYQTQRQWINLTDCDRLDQAFAELERRGILSRQNFACCSNCGYREIQDEIEEVRLTGRDVVGYTFYHLQITESAVEGYGLELYYGAMPRHPEYDEAVALEIVSILEAHDLNVTWSGNVSQLIAIKPFEWKRRRVEEDLSQVE